MYLVGIVALILGLLGFVNDPVLGVFETDAVHNIIHILAGILALAFANKGAQTKTWALILGVVFALITILGFMAGDGMILGFIANNGADNWLHLIMAVLLLIVGLKKSGGSSAAPAM